jgi:quercetin dioxygenase-like cupin family protein
MLIKDIKPKELVPGITGYYAHGSGSTLGYVELKKGSVVPLHQHIHEQITYIIEGELEMQIGDKKCLLSTGMHHVIPADVFHSALAVTDCKVIDDYKT